MIYFRLERRDPGSAFAVFLVDTLLAGATLIVADCRLRWSVTRLLRSRRISWTGGSTRVTSGGLPTMIHPSP